MPPAELSTKTWTTANIVTLVRICFTPVIALLPFIDGYWPKLICFIVFVLVAFTDMLDGYLARSRGEVTDLGKLLDPLADKLLLFATLIPIYWISKERQAEYGIPVWGSIPLWATLLMIGRELAMTVFRQWAKARGVVIAAGRRRQAQGGLPEHLRRRGDTLVRLPRCPQAARMGEQPLRLLLEPVPRRLRRGDAGDRGGADGLFVRGLPVQEQGPVQCQQQIPPVLRLPHGTRAPHRRHRTAPRLHRRYQRSGDCARARVDRRRGGTAHVGG